MRLEPARIEAGYAPFWRYLETGLYGRQLEHLYAIFPPEQVFVLRYRQLIDNTSAVLDEICALPRRADRTRLDHSEIQCLELGSGHPR